MTFKKILIAAAILGTGACEAAAPNPATATFQVQMKISKSCTVTAGAGSDMQLGTVDATSAVGTNGTSNVSVTCSKTTPYSIALQSGNNASTAGLGTLKGAAGNTDTLTYQLYSNSGLTTAWGNGGASLVSGTGTGAPVSVGVWAKGTGATPTLVTPDDYSDIVTVSVSF